MQDPTEFRKRFLLYKEGKMPYENGLPKYKNGTGGDVPAYQRFVEEMGPVLFGQIVAQGVKNPEKAYRNMITQLAYESNYGTSSVARNLNNYGGVGWNGKTYTTYKDKADFAKNYVQLMNSRYKNVIAADTLLDYAKGLKGLGYYEDSLENYSRNLTGMKSFAKALDSHIANNPDLYTVVSDKPTSQTTAAEFHAASLFEPTPVVIHSDYSLNNPAPSTISSWNNSTSPAFNTSGLYARRATNNINNVVQDILFNDKDVLDALMDNLSKNVFGGKRLGFKNGKLPGYRGGKPENGGVRYNPIYPVEKPLTQNQQYIQGDDGSWIRLTNPGMEAVVTARRPNVESDRQYTARRIAETQPERTWLSDAADIAHMVKETAMALDPYTAVPYFGARVGEDILNDNVGLNTALNGIFAITPFKQLPQFTLTPITDAAKGVVYGSKKLADELGFFVLKPGTYTRGIGITDAGVRDAIETGVFRGNPRGTEQTAKVFDKMFLKNRNNFRDIVKDTGIDGIESRYQSRTLTEEDFNALKLASKKYDRTDILKLGISLLPLSSDPLYKYKNYLEYLDDVLKTVRETNKMPRRIASGEIEVNNNLTNPIWFEDESGKMFLPQGRPINERFGPNSDYVSDGNPLSYWYGDGRNAITDGHAYARSNYMVRVNNPQDYIPFMHELHMHPSFFKTPKLSDPNVELFRRGPFGITIRMRKPKHNNRKLPEYKNGKSPIYIKPANRGKFTALKKRTGHSASWFKENGTPAQKKMAVFALNAKKWKH